MNSWPVGLVAAVLLWTGVALSVAAAWGAVLVRGDSFLRLHFLAPVSCLAVPLIAVGLALRSPPFAAAEIILVAALSVISGPVLSAATGRLIAQHTGVLPPTGPL